MNDCDRKLREQSLNALLLEGVNSGDPIPVDAEFWKDLRQEAIAKLEARDRATS